MGHLKSERREMQIFALQHIAAMTDSKKSSQETASFACRYILNSQEIGNILHDLHDARISNTSETSNDKSERYYDKDVEEEMMNLILTIWDNIMTATSKDKTLSDFM